MTLQLIKKEGDVTKDELDSVKAVLDKRVNNLGVSESNLQTLGSNQLILELPGEQDPLSAKRVIGKTALLEFRKQSPNTDKELRDLQLQRSKINILIKEFDELIKRKIDENAITKIKNSLIEIEDKISFKSNEKDIYKAVSYTHLTLPTKA